MGIWVDKMYRRGILNLDGTQAVKLTNYAMGAPVDGMVQMVQFGKKENKYNYAVLDNKGAKLFPKDIKKTFSEESPFHGCYPFENGVALVYPDVSSAYLIGKDGTPKTETYTGIIRIPGHGFITQRSGLYGFMDTAGAETIAPTYSLLMAPSLNPESILTAKNAQTGKYGFVTTTGQTFIPFEYEQAGFFSHGKGYVKTAGGWGVVDSGNNMIVSPKWQDIVMGVCDNDTHLWVQNPETGKWKCLEIKSGKIAFDDEYDNANAFDKDGMSVVARNGKYSVVRTSGKIVIPERLDTQEVCLKALGLLKEKALDEMSDIDAYRFNIYNHPDINKFTLTQKIESNLWDY